MAKKHPAVNISTGTVIGQNLDGIDRYLGIPYASDPWGGLRFAKPKPPEPWDDPLECYIFGATSPQSVYPGRIGKILGTVEIPGNNTLSANVWAPHDAIGLPVVLWIHGGALERGTPAIDVYDGSTFARDGVVFVSISYRLGSEGFSVLENVPLNLGLEDVAAGLRWVHNEISAFGGDPGRITVMGESAGGQLVAALLARKESTLMAAAIIQSAPLKAQKPQKAKRVTQMIAKRLGLKTHKDDFLGADPASLVKARDELMVGKTILDGVPSFALAIDGETLPVDLDEAVANAPVPILIGTNAQEHRLWFSEDALAKITPIKLWFLAKVFRVSRTEINKLRKQNPEANHGEILGLLITQKVFKNPMLNAARLRKSATYVYEFVWGTKKNGLDSSHALELGFTFDALQTEGAQRMADDSPQELADLMHSDWVQFIKNRFLDRPEFKDEESIFIYDAKA